MSKRHESLQEFATIISLREATDLDKTTSPGNMDHFSKTTDDHTSRNNAAGDSLSYDGYREMFAELEDKLGDKAGIGRIKQRMFDHAKEAPRLGRWDILHRVSHGAFGIVYAAYDPKLGRRVALKVLMASDSEEARARMLREAKAMARIKSDHVVPIYDYPDSEAGDVYIVMEYIDGATLRDHVRTCGRDLSAILDAYIQAGKGLAAIHKQSLVHRDIKPDNILVATDGRVVVADFGLASLTREGRERMAAGAAEGTIEVPSELMQTMPGAGTPAYTAPEQLSGEGADARSDQYSFCVSLYEAVFGQLPSSQGQAKKRARVPSGGEKPGLPGGRKVPGWLHEILQRGLAARRGERFPDMDALCKALERGRHQTRRRLLMAGGAAGLVLLPVIWLAAAPAATVPCDMAAKAELAQVWNAERKHAISAHMLESGVYGVGPAWNRLAGAMDMFGKTWASARTDLCHAQQHSHAPAAETQCVSRSKHFLEQVRDLVGKDKITPDRVVALYVLADMLDTGDICGPDGTVPEPADAWSGAQPAVTAAAAALDDSKIEAVWNRSYGAGTMWAGEYDAAVRSARTALGQASRLGHKHLAAEAQLWLGRAMSYQTYDQALLAAQELERATGLAADIHSHRLGAESWIELSKLASEVLREPALSRRALEAAKRELSYIRNTPAHPRQPQWAVDVLQAHVLEATGLLASLEGDGKAARDAHAQALDMFATMASGQFSLEATKSLNNLGRAWADSEDSERAITLYRRALAQRQALLGEQHPLVAEVLKNLGLEILKVGASREAEQMLTGALEIQERTYGVEDPRTLRARLALGSLFAQEPKDKERLLAICDQMARIHDRLSTPESVNPDQAQNYLLLAECYKQRKDIPRALAEVRRANALLKDAVHRGAVYQEDYGWTFVGLAELYLIGDGSAPLSRADHEAACGHLREAYALIQAEDHQEINQYLPGNMSAADVCRRAGQAW